MHITKIQKENLLYACIFAFVLISIILNRISNGFDNILWLNDLTGLLSITSIIMIAKLNKWALLVNAMATIFLAVLMIVQSVWFAAVICGINIPILLIGFIKQIKSGTKVEMKVNKLTTKQLIFTAIILLFMIIVCEVVLYYLNGNIFYLDAIASPLLLIAMFLLSKTYKDQFYFFILANIVQVAMGVILCLQNMNNLLFLIMQVCYCILNIKAYIEWNKKYKNDNTSIIS